MKCLLIKFLLYNPYVELNNVLIIIIVFSLLLIIHQAVIFRNNTWHLGSEAIPWGSNHFLSEQWSLGDLGILICLSLKIMYEATGSSDNMRVVFVFIPCRGIQMVLLTGLHCKVTFKRFPQQHVVLKIMRLYARNNHT